MKNKEKKLGKGLSALMGSSYGVLEETNSEGKKRDSVQMIAIDNIVAGIYQPRKIFDQDELNDLSQSIQVNGVIQPIIVRKADGTSGIYEIIAGERRFRASKIAGMTSVPTIVKDITDLQAIEFSIIENVQRADLSSIEEAASYRQLMNEFGYTQDDVAKRVGRSRSHVANVLRLLSLPEDVQGLVNKGQLSTGHARALVGREDASVISAKIVKESLSVRDVEELLQVKQKKAQSQALVKGQVTEADLTKRALKSQYLRTVEDNLLSVTGLKVKASYDANSKKGKISIFYNELSQIEGLISQLER